MRRSIPPVLSAIAGVLLAGALILPVGAQEATDHIMVTPSAARPGDTVTVSGRLECPDSAPGGHVNGHVEYIDDAVWVRAGWDGRVGDDPLSYPALSADRTFSVSWTIPTTMREYGYGEMPMHPTPAGEFDIFVFCNEGDGPGTQARGTFTVLPAEQPTTTTTEATTTTTQVTTTTTTVAQTEWTPPASPPSIAEVFEDRPVGPVPAGSDIEIDEDGFVPGEDVRVVLYSSPRTLATLVADATGRVRGTVTIPADTEVGEHVLVLYGTDLVRAMALDVSAAIGDPTDPGTTDPTDPGTTGGGSAAPTAPATTPANLPRTGSGTTVLAVLGTVLTGAGAGLLRLRRRLELAHL